jgi:tetratricopeptide (TPR) repeat protein
VRVLTKDVRGIVIGLISLGIIPQFVPYAFAEDGTRISSSNLCDQADVLLSLKLYDLATAEYTKVAASASENTDCANLGLKKVTVLKEQAQEEAHQKYSVGLAYAEAEKFDEAIEAYLETLSIDPTFQDAQTEFNKVLDKLQLASVESLVQQGAYLKAQERLEAIQASRNINIPEHLQFLNQGPISYWFHFRRDWRLWLEILTALLIAIVACLVIRWRLYPWFQGLLSLRLEIQSFEDGPSDDFRFGRGVASIVQEAIRIYDSQLKYHRLDLVTGSIEPFRVPSKLANLAPPLAILNDLIAWITPPNILKVSGCIQYSDSRGVGLTVVLIENRTGKIIRTHTFWKINCPFNRELQILPEVSSSESSEHEEFLQWGDDFFSLSSCVALWLIDSTVKYQWCKTFE